MEKCCCDDHFCRVAGCNAYAQPDALWKDASESEWVQKLLFSRLHWLPLEVGWMFLQLKCMLNEYRGRIYKIISSKWKWMWVCLCLCLKKGTTLQYVISLYGKINVSKMMAAVFAVCYCTATVLCVVAAVVVVGEIFFSVFAFQVLMRVHKKNCLGCYD